MVTSEKHYTVMILDDEEDNLALYSDYLTSIGHTILHTYVNGENIMQDIDVEAPDIYIVDYILPGVKNGIDVAVEILKKCPLSCIIFLTAFELLGNEISKHDIFYDKNIEVLIKPVKLNQIQNSILNLVH